MNKIRRYLLSSMAVHMMTLCDIMEDLDSLNEEDFNEFSGMIKKMRVELKEILADEEESFYNRSEGSQQTESGQISEMAIESMYEALDNMDDALYLLIEAKQALTSRKQKRCLNDSYGAMLAAYDALCDIDGV